MVTNDSELVFEKKKLPGSSRSPSIRNLETCQSIMTQGAKIRRTRKSVAKRPIVNDVPKSGKM